MSGGDIMEKDVKIKGGEILLTNEKESIYEVVSGDALVYIVPLENDNSIGRRLFVCEVNQGEQIPALCYTDFEEKDWRFAIVAIDETVVGTIKPEEIDKHKESFAKRISLKNYEMEGFEEGLVEWYRLQILKEDGFIHKTGQDQKHTYEEGLKLIYTLFNSIPKKVEEKTKNNITYDAVRFLCNKKQNKDCKL